MSLMQPVLRQLGDEPFGHKLARARRESGVELREAAEKISEIMFTSHSRLHQLEKLAEPPSSPSRRALAYLAMLVYGFDPAELGLSADDLPKELRTIVGRNTPSPHTDPTPPSTRENRSTIWYGASDTPAKQGETRKPAARRAA